MTVAPPGHTRATFRLGLSLSLLLVAAALVAAIVSAGALAGLLHVLYLILASLAIYAWVIYPFRWALVTTLGTLLAGGWAWAAHRTATLQLELIAFLALAGAALAQQRWRAARRIRLLQALEAIADEQRGKQQALEAAAAAREAMQRKLSRYAELQSLAEALSGLLDDSAAAGLVVERAFALIGKSDRCLLFLLDKEAQALALFASTRQEGVPAIRSKHGDQFDRHVLRTHRPLLVNDVRRDFRFTASAETDHPVSAVIACPLVIGHSPEGVLRLDSGQTGAYTQDDLRFLDILLDLLAVALTNARLFAQTQQLAITDGLTGLLIRRPWLEQAAREVTRAARRDEPLAILMIDVDHFKQYNDSFGHPAGDQVLRSVAGLLRQAVPSGSHVGRYGGEEFAIVLPKHARADAMKVAEAIRLSVERSSRDASQPRHRAAERPPVTVSIGVAVAPDDARSDLELIRMADHRLYQAKREGRNRVAG